MNIPERLTAAADRLEALDHAGTWSPWRSGESWAGGLAVLTGGGHPIAVVSQGSPSDTARADADLIVTLRPLAPLIARQLRDAVDRLREECEIELDYAPFHRDGYCGRDVDPDQRGGCKHWEHDLALADAILGGAS